MGSVLIEKRLVADLRRECGLSQARLAERAHVGLRTVIRLEQGQSVNYGTAYVILEVFNSFRAEQRKPLLTIEDIAWEIR